jgi:hypothetical protein
MANQVVIPSSGAAAARHTSPQPVAFPYASGTPPEGPLSALVATTIPAGQLSATSQFNVSQFGMSMVQSLLVDNEANDVAISVHAGTTGAAFGIQPAATQIIPVFQTGTNLTIMITLAQVQAIAVVVAFQIFNSFVPPASWVANLSVSGNVNIVEVAGNVNVVVQNASLLGISLEAEPFGGASGFVTSALTNSVVKVKNAAGNATFKGFVGTNGSTISWLQLFDAATPTAVTLGTTPPNYTFPVIGLTSPIVPPEGLAFLNGLQGAFTLGPTNATPPSAAFAGTLFYA